jgi:hypothetical protein
MTAGPTPPRWTEAVLRLVLRPDDFASVSGDLLEAYRDSIHPARGQRRADLWYLAQVFGFLSRRARVWAALLGMSLVARNALDWFVPPVDFHLRSTITTFLSAGLLLTAGFWFARRSGSLLAGALGGAATTVLACAVSFAGAAALLAVWHDPETMAAIRQSGGLSEVFTLPLFMVVPGAVLGTIGGAVGSMTRRLR